MSTKPTSIDETKTSEIEDMMRSFISTHHLTSKWDNFISSYPSAHSIIENSRPDNLIEESPEEAAKQYANSKFQMCSYHSDDRLTDFDNQFSAFIAGANHQKEVDKANVEQIFNRAIVGNNEFIKVMEKQGTPSDQTALYFKKLNRDLTDLIKQIKAL